VPTKNDQDAQLDLNEAIDSLLVDIEETTNSYAPPEEQAIDTNMMITDDGAEAALPETQEPEAELESELESESDAETSEPESETEVEAEADLEADLEIVDSIENAQQALEALDEVENQAEDLVAQSIDALLENADASAQDDTPEETVDSVDPTPEPEAEPEAEAAEDSVTETPEAIETIDEPEPEAQTDDPEVVDNDEIIENDKIVEIDEAEFDADLLDTDSLDDSMDMLDSALADAADDMLDGDFETEEGELVTGEAVATALEEAIQAQPIPDSDEKQEDAAALSDILGDAVDDLLSPDEVAMPAADPVAPKPKSPPTPAQTTAQPAVAVATKSTAATSNSQDETKTQHAAPQDQDAQAEIKELEELHNKKALSVPAWFERSVEIIRPKIDKIDPLKGKTMDALAFVIGSALVAIMTHATPIAAKMAILISKPLAKQSPEVRNALGYIALWTGFLAVVLWVYLLMFRTPTVPHPETAPSRVIHADESLIVAPLLPTIP